jgi:hypothetical protein
MSTLATSRIGQILQWEQVSQIGTLPDNILYLYGSQLEGFVSVKHRPPKYTSDACVDMGSECSLSLEIGYQHPIDQIQWVVRPNKGS